MNDSLRKMVGLGVFLIIFAQRLDMNSDKFLLAPYYWALCLRHLCYDKGWMKVQTAPVPTICVGNIAVGGTGKTPFTELLLKMLGTAGAAGMADGGVGTDGVTDTAGVGTDGVASVTDTAGVGRVGVLSKGYGRKSKGFLYVTPDGTPGQFGDEPLQIKRKFPGLPVAVCSSRIKGCRQMAGDGCGLIILDDAFQHRALKADCNIVLVEYGRPLRKDHLLPLGRLRDIPERVADADIIIASKCPDDLTAAEREAWLAGLGLEGAYDAVAGGADGERVGAVAGGAESVSTEAAGLKADPVSTEDVDAETKGQKKSTPVFFTTSQYGQAEGVFEEADRHYLYSGKMILVSGIANDRPLRDHLSERYRLAGHLHFPDHHDFRPGDLRKIELTAARYPEAVIITTEKDVQRLLPLRDAMSASVRSRLFYQPIETRFMTPDEQAAFQTALSALLSSASSRFSQQNNNFGDEQ